MFRLLALVSLAVVAASAAGSEVEAARCQATAADALGPFYVPGAPVRSRVGAGYVLSGKVLASGTCRGILRARVELWLVNPEGEYDVAHRATLFSGRAGSYRFTSNKPPPYSGRPPHIHVRVSARGFRTLVTQHYPRAGQARATFNLVLRRAAG